MIEMIQLKILQYDDYVIQLLQLFAELHSHITDIIFLHHYYNQYHDIYHDKHQVLVTKIHHSLLNLMQRSNSAFLSLEQSSEETEHHSNYDPNDVYEKKFT
jgi:hypothetical protein